MSENKMDEMAQDGPVDTAEDQVEAPPVEEETAVEEEAAVEEAPAVEEVETEAVADEAEAPAAETAPAEATAEAASTAEAAPEASETAAKEPAAQEQESADESSAEPAPEVEAVKVAPPAEYVPSVQRGRSRRIRVRISMKEISFKNVPLLTRFLDPYGRILSRRKTGVSAKMQRKAVREIKRARHLSLLPYTGDHTRVARLKRRR